MKKFCKQACLATLISMTFICCNDTSTDNAKQVSQDSGDKKYNPAGVQKDNNTYDQRRTATDSMYKNEDSINKK